MEKINIFLTKCPVYSDNTHNRREFSAQALMSLCSPSGLSISQLLITSIVIILDEDVQIKLWVYPSVSQCRRLRFSSDKERASGSATPGRVDDFSTVPKRRSQYLCTAIIIQNWWHTGSRCAAIRILLFIPESHRRPPHNPGPDYVTSPGVSAPSFRRSLSVSLPGKAFISLRHELKSFPSAFALGGTSCKRWTSPHCSLATASQPLHPCTTQSLLCKFLPPVILSHSCSALWTASVNRGSSLCLLELCDWWRHISCCSLIGSGSVWWCHLFSTQEACVSWLAGFVKCMYVLSACNMTFAVYIGQKISHAMFLYIIVNKRKQYRLSKYIYLKMYFKNGISYFYCIGKFNTSHL